MKQFILFLALSTGLTLQLKAQDEKEEKEKGFKKENLFTGGNVTASFFNGSTILGASPLFGYKLTNWADAGIVLNFTYSGTRDYLDFNDKLRQTIFGGGVFARLYPVRFLFLQAQPEHNFTRVRYVDRFGSTTRYTTDANSFLVGGGLAQGREKGSNSFYYVCLLFDVIKNENSPYVDVKYNQLTGEKRVSALPILRAGINVGLFQGRYNRGER